MMKKQDGYLLVEVAAAFLVLTLGLALFGTALRAAANEQSRRQAQQKQLQSQLERYYASPLDEGEPRTLTLDGPDFHAEIPARQHVWQEDGLTLYEFTPEEGQP